MLTTCHHVYACAYITQTHDITPGFRERLLADPSFMVKLAIEVGIGVCTKCTAEYTKRQGTFSKVTRQPLCVSVLCVCVYLCRVGGHIVCAAGFGCLHACIRHGWLGCRCYQPQSSPSSPLHCFHLFTASTSSLYPHHTTPHATNTHHTITQQQELDFVAANVMMAITPQ